MALDVTADLVRFDEALEWFLSRLLLSADDLAILEANASASAFWASGLTDLRVVQDVFDDLAWALENGQPFREWQKLIGDKLHGAWSLRGKAEATRLQVIYRNATQAAYNRGRHEQMTEPVIKELRPQWMYDAIMDSRTSPICKPLDGIIKPADDPWWQDHTPPLHHQCRSGIRCLTDEQAREKLGSGAKAPDGGPRFRTEAPAVDAQEGFGQAPKPNDKPADDYDLSDVDAGLRESLQRKARAAGE
jgi:SPP1 gp7 family putative phage head morphogenesis protein